MEFHLEPAVAFGSLLRENAEAAQFYDNCTPTQKEAILLQLQEIHSPENLKAFVDQLPSAAL